MSMIGSLVRVSRDQLNSFLKDSSLLEEYIDSEEVYESDRFLDIDKSWEAIFYLLTGQTIDTADQATPPLGIFFFTGQFIDEHQDLGYGPAQYLNPEQVKSVDKAISRISEADFISKYNADEMNKKKVYHSSWQEGEDDKEYLTTHFRELKDFYAKAAGEQNAVITYVS